MSIEVIRGDITKQTVDAIVNAANETLLGGGGVDGAIHRAAGPELLAHCRKMGGCATGHACITPGFQLSADYIIHTVGPVWRGGEANESSQLASCYRESLTLAKQHHCKIVAFPAISCGVFGYPLDTAASVSIAAVIAYQRTHTTPQHVRWVMLDQEVFDIWEATIGIMGKL